MTSKFVLLTLFTAILMAPSMAALDVTIERNVHYLDEDVDVHLTDMNGTGLLEVDMPNGTPLLFTSLGPTNGSVSFTFQIFGPSGTYSIWVTDSNDEVNETFELLTPEFALGDVTLSGKPLVSKTVNIRTTIFNNGTTMGSARVAIYEGAVNADNLVTFSNISLNTGENNTVIGTWTPSSKGATTLIVQVSAISPGEWNTSDNTASVTITVGSPSEDDASPLLSDPLIIIIISSIVAVVIVSAVLGALMSSDSGRYALACAFLPLYTRLNHERLLDNRKRFLIYGFIVENPGEHFSAIRSTLRLNSGTTVYHLRVLEREGKITSMKEGKYRRFYVKGGYAIPDRSTKLSKAQMEIVEILSDNPGITQQDLARTLNKAPSTINHHVKHLEAMDVIMAIETDRRTKRYVIASPLPPHQCPSCETIFTAKTADYCPGCGRELPTERTGHQDRRDRRY